MKITELAWIYSADNYQEMYSLTDEDLACSILDFPAGLSSFNAEMHSKGHNIISGDRLYQLDAENMQQRIDELLLNSEQSLRQNASMLRKNEEKYIEKITAKWRNNAQIFFQDYALGKQENRYQYIHLPDLPFKDHEFELALCSDLLFHSETHQQGNHMLLVKELCRVAEEVRVFPLMDEKGKITSMLGPVLMDLQQQNCGLEIREVGYEKNKGANAMLRIWSTECVVK